MEMTLSSAQRLALRALVGGTLERANDGWIVVGVREGIVLPDLLPAATDLGLVRPTS